MFEKSFTIDYNDYIGDFDLESTINSGQTSQPPWIHGNNSYHEVVEIDNSHVLVSIQQDELNAPLNVNYSSDDDVCCGDVQEKLYHIFDLDYDTNKLYDFLQEDEKLVNVYQFNKGLRLYKAQYPFECIISSICSANNSIKRWTKSIMDIRQNHGIEHKFNDVVCHTFPSEEDFINIVDEELKKCGVGYRSSYMLDTTEMILSDADFHKKIGQMSYDKAFRRIEQLSGVGPKVADCILLYGYNKREAYPVDVWINRITTYLYFNNEKTSNANIMSFAQDKFGEYSGYVQLYLFNCARLSGLMDKLRVK